MFIKRSALLFAAAIVGGKAGFPPISRLSYAFYSFYVAFSRSLQATW